MKAFLGVDVQSRRKLSYFACDGEGSVLCSRWLSVDEDHRGLVTEVSSQGFEIAGVGIDAPRHLLPGPRAWYWDGRKREWRRRRETEKGFGRHCEVVVSAHGLANPQWTPPESDAAKWLLLGTRLYKKLAPVASTYEVFPSASYRQLQGEIGLTAKVEVGQLAAGPKDMLDACIAAITVREYLAGHGVAVGGGDSLGEIILPRRIEPRIQEVFNWPP